MTTFKVTDSSKGIHHINPDFVVRVYSYDPTKECTIELASTREGGKSTTIHIEQPLDEVKRMMYV